MVGDLRLDVDEALAVGDTHERVISPSVRQVNGQHGAGAGTSTRMFEAYSNLARALGAPAMELKPSVPDEFSASESHEGALKKARTEAGACLDSSRVRVGVTRGHLLEVVVQVPLDTTGDPEALQLAAEVYLEALLGTALLDEWVASVAIDRIARTTGLLVVSDGRSVTSAHPLSEAAPLIRLGIEGIRSQLPDSQLSLAAAGDNWTALEIPETESGLQPERCFASTRFPEALKCALEGMPFSSTRFTRGSEKLCWLSWRGRGAAAPRLRARSEVETLVSTKQCEAHLLLAGSGFGPRRDYLDLWTMLAWAELPKLLLSLASTVEGLEFGLYDSPYSEKPIQIGF